MSYKLVDAVLSSGATAAGLTPHQQLVRLVMARYANDDGGECYPSFERLADLTRLDRRTIIRAIKTLEVKGLVLREVSGGGRHRTNHYRLVVPGNSVTGAQETVSAGRRLAEETVSPVRETVSPVRINGGTVTPDSIRDSVKESPLLRKGVRGEKHNAASEAAWDEDDERFAHMHLPAVTA